MSNSNILLINLRYKKYNPGLIIYNILLELDNKIEDLLNRSSKLANNNYNMYGYGQRYINYNGISDTYSLVNRKEKKELCVNIIKNFISYYYNGEDNLEKSEIIKSCDKVEECFNSLFELSGINTIRFISDDLDKTKELINQFPKLEIKYEIEFDEKIILPNEINIITK